MECMHKHSHQSNMLYKCDTIGTSLKEEKSREKEEEKQEESWRIGS